MIAFSKFLGCNLSLLLGLLTLWWFIFLPIALIAFCKSTFNRCCLSPGTPSALEYGAFTTTSVPTVNASFMGLETVLILLDLCVHEFCIINSTNHALKILFFNVCFTKNVQIFLCHYSVTNKIQVFT